MDIQLSGFSAIQQLAKFIERRSPKTLVAYAILMTLLLGIFDLQTGVEGHFLLLYLVPIFIGSWFVSREVGVYLAFFGSLIWFAADSLGGRTYSSAWIAYWNMVTRTSVFVLFAVTQAQLRTKLNELSKLASRDLLTGLPNGHAFYQLAAKEMDRAFGLEPMTLACIDVTGFHWVNHRFGYPMGDQMVCKIAHTIKQHVPRPDLVGRMGGTSFAVLMPNVASETANFVLEGVHHALNEERRKFSHPLTFFISAIACTKAPRTVAELLHEADAQMTRMKGGKKDSLEIANVDVLPMLN
jgi:diguanylate cyclase (GGDEF)-like protein